HGHIIDLIDKKANRIFMPYVVYESKEDKNTPNSFNCPIVSGYSDVIKSSMPFLEKHNICIDAPTIAFNNEQLLTKACIKYLMTLGIEKSLVEKALPKALAAQRMYVSSLQENCQRIIEKNSVGNNMVIMLVGRPYHADPLIQHKISDMISAFGVDVISEDFVRSEEHNTFDNVQTIMQWAYTNRILKAAEWVAKTNANVHLVQMTSFGCGPDAFIIDEVNEILKRHGKSHTILKIDDVNNIGSLRLRIRSLIESLRFASDKEVTITPLIKNKIFTEEDKHRTILVPFFSEYYSPFVPVLFKLAGYNFVTLPPSDVHSSELGLKFANNEVCYPATLVIGDIIKALQTRKYNRDEIAIGITQTGGQCRATNYLSLIKKAMVAAGYEDIPV
ncbi:MAG TPA: acyl-CoA dehydratase activase-related protein, partial [Bacteroidales bacterium]|nr:acyl-CoA dehydratase activase-related protein [Bacteroidales bacterium]